MTNKPLMPISHRKKAPSYPKTVFKQVFISERSSLEPFGEVFMFSPENYEEQRLGHIFGVIKIDDHSPDSSYVVNLLTSVIKKEYFSKPDRPAEESFEASLRKANLALAELARHGVVSWTGKINFAAGSLERNNLHFSQLGNTHIFLLRAGQIADIAEDLHIPKEAEPHPLRTFSNISSGKLEKNDKLIFTTDDLLEIFSPEEIRQNAAYFDWQEFPSFIEASLKTNTSLSGTIIMDFRDAPLNAKIAKKVPMYEHLEPAPKSEDEIMIKEAPIREPIPALDIVTPSVEKESLYVTQVEEAPMKESYFKIIFAWLIENLLKLVLILRDYVLKSISFLKSLGLPQRKIPTNFSESSGKNLLDRVKSSGSKIKDKLNFSALKNKINFKYAGIIIAALLIIFFSILSFQKISSKKSPPAENSTEEIVPVGAVLNDISIKEIASLENIANFSQSTNGIALMDDSLYAITEPSSIIKINPANGQIEEAKSAVNSGNFFLLAAMPDLNTLFIFTENKKVISYTPINKNFQESQISLPGGLKVADIKTYLTYLYILDSSANQIYRFPRAEGGFGEPQNWLKSGQDLKSAKKIAINEDIFAMNNINIIPLLQGKTDTAVDFQKTQVPLRLDAIYTAPGLNNIYVLDNTNNRVVQYAKDGKILNQFWNKDIAGFDSLVVDEKNNAIYLMQRNKLLKFSF